MLSVDEGLQRAVEKGVVVRRPAALRLVRLTGPQRVWFLQNTITADVDNVPDGRWVESCFLDPKGRVQSHFKVGFLGEEIWIDAEPDAGLLATWFETYRFRTKVEFATHERSCTTVLGPAATTLAASGAITRSGEAVCFGYDLGDVAAVDVHGEGPPGLDEADPELYEVLRVEAGRGVFGVDFGERDLPQEAGLTRVVSVQKGCYVGQETVARIHFRGHVNRVSRTLRIEGAEPGSLVGRNVLVDGTPVGRVTSAVRSPRSGVVGIAMVRVEPPAGTRADLDGGGTAILGPLPEGTKVKSG